MPDPRTAVVIATRNRAGSLAAALEHLLDLPERPHVLVVDNGSSDDTPALIRTRFPQAALVSLGENRGAAARNIGVERITTPYVAFADDDSWYDAGALSHAADCFDRYPRLGLVAGRVLVGPEELLDPTCEEMATSPLGREALPGPAVLGFLACGAVVRRAAFLQAGGFAPGFGVGGEEDLLAMDLAAAGWRLAYVPAVVARHHPPPRPDTWERRRVQVRNALWCAWLRHGVAAALGQTIRVVRQAVREPAGRAGVLAAVGGLRQVLRARRPVPNWLDEDLRRLGR
jgi:GT2 family glycosyltransferase